MILDPIGCRIKEGLSNAGIYRESSVLDLAVFKLRSPVSPQFFGVIFP